MNKKRRNGLRRQLLQAIEQANIETVLPVIHGLYLLLRKGKVVYVGQSKDVHQRIMIHAREGEKDFDEYQVISLPFSNLDRAEALLIVTLGFPQYNQTLPHNPWWGSTHTIASELNTYPGVIASYASKHELETVPGSGYYYKADFREYIGGLADD